MNAKTPAAKVIATPKSKASSEDTSKTPKASSTLKNADKVGATPKPQSKTNTASKPDTTPKQVPSTVSKASTVPKASSTLKNTTKAGATPEPQSKTNTASKPDATPKQVPSVVSKSSTAPSASKGKLQDMSLPTPLSSKVVKKPKSTAKAASKASKYYFTLFVSHVSNNTCRA